MSTTNLPSLLQDLTMECPALPCAVKLQEASNKNVLQKIKNLYFSKTTGEVHLPVSAADHSRNNLLSKLIGKLSRDVRATVCFNYISFFIRALSDGCFVTDPLRASTLRNEICIILDCCPEATSVSSCDGSLLIHVVAGSRNPDVLILGKILSSNPECGSLADGYGLNALHLLLDHDSPCVKSVKLILQHCPSAARTLSSSNKLPVHAIFKRGFEDSLFKTLLFHLLDYYPECLEHEVVEHTIQIQFNSSAREGYVRSTSTWTIMSKAMADHTVHEIVEKVREKQAMQYIRSCWTHRIF